MSLLPRVKSLITILLFLATPALAQSPVVRTADGALQGAVREGVQSYLGIPFAAPPVGPNRWRAPQPVTAWEGTRDATRFGHSCWQGVTPGGFGPWSREYVVQGDVSEDCLYLNLWAPAERRAPLPVLVWIYGGGFNSGSGALPLYDGRRLAARGIIVVNVNYRVGALGFLAHPELTAEARASAAPPANFGLQDIVAALEWVKATIAAFGGNPDAVTVAGQSAGSMAIHGLIVSPQAEGLFQRAILQSGLPGALPVTTLAQAEADGSAFAKEKGAASLAALRALPAHAIQPAEGGNSGRFRPVVDGILLPEQPAEALAAGRFHDVPVMTGFTADEGSALRQDYASADPVALRTLMEESFGASAVRLAPFYPAATEADRAQSNVQVRRDRGLAALYHWASARPAKAPAFLYLFSHVQPGPEAARWRAFHSSELPYIFQTFDAAPERAWSEADRRLSEKVAGYWINFVRSGDPNGAGLPAWPPLDTADPRILEIGDAVAARDLLPAAKLELIRGLEDKGGLTIF